MTCLGVCSTLLVPLALENVSVLHFVSKYNIFILGQRENRDRLVHVHRGLVHNLKVIPGTEREPLRVVSDATSTTDDELTLAGFFKHDAVKQGLIVLKGQPRRRK